MTQEFINQNVPPPLVGVAFDDLPEYHQRRLRALWAASQHNQ